MRLGGQEPPRQQPDAPWADVANFGSEYRVGIAASFCVALLAVALYGFGSVEITEFGLNYSLVTRKVENRTYMSGRYWISPVNVFIKFPAVLTTIQFSESAMQADLSAAEQGEDKLQSRTRDGLNVAIELSFQYQLMHDQVYDLYTKLGGYPDYHNVFVRLAVDRLTESATSYSATEFFTERTAIGQQMEALLKKDFNEQLHANVFSFQLRTVALPGEFESAIQETEVKRQDLKVAEAEQNSTRVSLETDLMQAKKRTQVKANQGEAEASAVMLENSADITQYLASQRRSADSYEGVLKELDSKEADMLAYMQARVLRDHPGGKTVVGLDLPALAKQ